MEVFWVYTSSKTYRVIKGGGAKHFTLYTVITFTSTFNFSSIYIALYFHTKFYNIVGSLNWRVPAWTFSRVISDVLILRVCNFFELATSLRHSIVASKKQLQKLKIKKSN